MIAAIGSEWTEQRVDPLLHERLVKHVANRYRNRGLDFEDLVQEGMLGLMRACETFDPSRQLRFSTYASKWVRHYIQRAVQNNPNPVRVPIHLHVTRARIYVGRAARDELPRRQLAKVEAADVAMGAERAGEHELCNLVADDAEDYEEGPVGHARRILAEMPRRDRELVAAYLGIGRDAPVPLNEMAIGLGVTRQRLWQKYADAIARTRARIKSRAEAMA